MSDTGTFASAGRSDSPQDSGNLSIKLRSYDGWWWRAAAVPAVDSKTGEPGPIEAWVALGVADNDRLERGLADPSLCEFPEGTVVHDTNGQRMCLVDYANMEMRPLYWSGPGLPVRRCIWMEMKSLTEDLEGGAPVASDWDAALEAAYQANAEWLAQDPAGKVVEKIVALPEPLAALALILRQGEPHGAKLIAARKLDRPTGLLPSGIFERDCTIRLIRGYIPYHIAVMGAIQMAQSGKSSRSSGGSKSPPAPSGIKPMVLPSPFELPLPEEEISPPKELVFAVHGIGQKFAGRLGGNFIYDCECLRTRMCQAVTLRGGKLEDITLLPVNWRSGLKMGIQSWFPGGQRKSEESFEELVARITLDNIPAVRDVASDVGLDILLYMTPGYFRRIIESALCEIRRQYQIFLRANGPRASDTKVSFIGHSLGSAIVSDLLSFIAEDESDCALAKSAMAVFRNLGFSVDRFFAIGSPLPMFFLLKQLRPKGCLPNVHAMYKQCTAGQLAVPGAEEGGDNEFYPSLPEPSSSRELKPRDVYFACREMYNIFHPYDPRKTTLAPYLITNHTTVPDDSSTIVAYRMEPLVVPPEEMLRFTKPVLLPYCKKGALHLKRQMEDGMQEWKERAFRAKEDLVNSVTRSLNVLPEWLRASLRSPVAGEGGKSIEGAVEESQHLDATQQPRITTHTALMRFNRHGRIDFSIEEALFESAYISAISSHLSYWEDIDVASFLAVEIGGLPIKPLLGFASP